MHPLTLFQLLGGLALFLLGMEQLTNALQTIAGKRMREVLDRLTGNRFMAVLTGAVVTAVIQSSSVTSVLVVGFVSAGLMNLTQSVGVILGANVGTSVTAQIIAFKISELAFMFIAFGFFAHLIIRNKIWRQAGLMLMGLGLIFFGMEVMGEATAPMRDNAWFLGLMQQLDNVVLGLAIGAVFTAIVQSSSATIGIVLVLASQGLITLEAAIGLVLGAKIGTSVTAVLAAIGRPRIALRTASIHVMYNVLGSCLWVLLLVPLAEWARIISPISTLTDPLQKQMEETPRQVANAYTTFCLLNAVIFLPFTNLLARLATWCVPDKQSSAEADVSTYLDRAFITVTGFSVSRCSR